MVPGIRLLWFEVRWRIDRSETLVWLRETIEEYKKAGCINWSYFRQHTDRDREARESTHTTCVNGTLQLKWNSTSRTE